MRDYAVLDIETSGDAPWKGELICVGMGGRVYRPDEGRKMARLLMAKRGTTIVSHTNYDLRWLTLDGARLADGVIYHDTKVMAWMLDSTQELDLESLVVRYLGYVPPKLIKMRSGRVMFQCEDGELRPIENAPWDEVAAYNQSDIDSTAELYEHLRASLQEQDLWELYVTEEAPFSRLLIEMESAGLPFDPAEAELLREKAIEQGGALKAEVIAATGVPDFNPGSPAQVASYLYDEICQFDVKFDIPRLNGIAPERKQAAVESIAPPGVVVTKIGRDYAYGTLTIEGRGLKAPKIEKWKPADARPTTNAKTLRVMHGNDPWVQQYLHWKQVVRMEQFLTQWLGLKRLAPDGTWRLHGRFDQSGTVTGRLSGKEPNLQQVPTDEEWNVRRLFPGNLVIGDYAGLEVRLSAHFSRDPVMMDIFANGKDLYGTLAAHAWGGPETKENENRGLFKILMLASQYGAQGEKLAMTLALGGMHFTTKQANDLLKDLQSTMPRLFEWREEVVDQARALGYVVTLAGRKRHLPNINSADWHDMAKSERQAVNSIVQGSAADVVRRAMLRCREAVDPESARIILQVHDEILWERMPGWKPEDFDTIVTLCETGFGFDLDVPLVFEAKVAQAWSEKGTGGSYKASARATSREQLEEVLTA